MTINVIGNILDSSGYANHVRGLLNALIKITDVRLSSQIQPGQEMLLNDREILALKNKKPCDVNLIITNPNYWRMYSTAKINIAYLVWEGDTIPESFVEEIINPEITAIIVPSKHTMGAIKARINNPVYLEKIHIIPHGVNLDDFYPTDKPEKFTFVANKGFRNLEDRGGVQYLIRAFAEEFKKDEKVELFIKLNPVYGIPNLDAAVTELVKGIENYHPISVSTELVPYGKMNKIYNKGHVFVSPSRAEAFNLPCIEAMACGLPVITTNYGGQTDFVNEENGWIVGGELTEVKHEIQYEGIKWLTPDIKELREAMRDAFNNYNGSKKPTNALETAKRFQWANTAEKIVNLVETVS